MANQDAWDTGWSLGSQAAKRKTPKPVQQVFTSDGQTLTPSDPMKYGGVSDKTAWGGALSLLPRFKKGGPVKRTGLAVLHKGEYVVPAKRRSKKASKRPVIKH